MKTHAFVDAFEKVKVVGLTLALALGSHAGDALVVVLQDSGAALARLASLLDRWELANWVFFVGLGIAGQRGQA